MATAASITAANLTAECIGEEVKISEEHGAVTLTGKLEGFSIRQTASTRDPKGNPGVPSGLDRFTVKVWIEGHKLEIRGGNEVSMLKGGIPGNLPIS